MLLETAFKNVANSKAILDKQFAIFFLNHIFFALKVR